MAPRRSVVCSHGHCFDGLASAAAFARLLETLESSKPSFEHKSCGYGPKLRAVPESWLTGDANAILDFRYTESDRLHFYFDHHVTGLGSEDEIATARERVEATRGRRRFHWDPGYGSCTKLVHDVAREHYGVRLDDLDELVAWADRIDTARFDAPDDAFFARAPAVALADVIERHGDSDFYQRWAPRMGTRPLDEILADEELRLFGAAIAEDKRRHLEAVHAKGRMIGRVALVDLLDDTSLPAGKFATYVAFPRCVYSVALVRTPALLKIGVGYNPWSGVERDADIASLCAAEGGGGHPVVGGVAVPSHDVDRARAIADRIVKALVD
jgi:hypothetical protein